jgi:hypothetical protein
MTSMTAEKCARYMSRSDNAELVIRMLNTLKREKLLETMIRVHKDAAEKKAEMEKAKEDRPNVFAQCKALCATVGVEFKGERLTDLFDLKTKPKVAKKERKANVKDPQKLLVIDSDGYFKFHSGVGPLSPAFKQAMEIYGLTDKEAREYFLFGKMRRLDVAFDDQNDVRNYPPNQWFLLKTKLPNPALSKNVKKVVKKGKKRK